MNGRRECILSFVLLFVMLIFLGLGQHRLIHAQVCGEEVGCGQGTDGCSGLLMSTLPAVNIHASGGWYVPEEDLSTHCGVKDCFTFLPFKCACGQPYSGRLCTANERDGL